MTRSSGMAGNDRACKRRHLRSGAAEDGGQLPPAEPARLPGLERRRLPAADGRGLRRHALQLWRACRPLPPARQRPCPPRHRQGRHRGRALPEHAADAGGALRHPDAGGRAQRPQPAPGCGLDRLHPGAWRGQGAAHRQRARTHRQGGPGPGPAADPGDRHRRSCGPGRAAGRAHLRGAAGNGRSGVRVDSPGRRVGRALALLHLGHHRQPEGCRLPPSRRLPERARQRAGLRPQPAARSTCGRCRCSTATAGPTPGRVTAAGGTHVCLRKVDPAVIFPTLRDETGDASVRRPGRADHADPRAGRGEVPLRAEGGGRHRRGRPAKCGDRGHGGHGLPRHPPLRPDRDLRAFDRLRSRSPTGRACRSASAPPSWPGRVSATRPCTACRWPTRRR